MLIKRYLEKPVIEDLLKKMVFLSGPRQVGKTTLAKGLFSIFGHDKEESKKRYLNWDATEDRENILNEIFPFGAGLLILDEIHKYSRWRQIVKALFDKRGDELKILVTGSAMLDFYRYGGDSLQGRYHFYRLHPLSLSELNSQKISDLNDLFIYGGFPEPFFLASESETRRWSREYRTHLIREDLLDLERINEVSLLEKMAIRLPDLVGSPLSVNALREDLQVSHQTVSRWLNILEKLYSVFRIYPFGGPRIRAVKKEAKHYHYDWTQVKDSGARFENMIASHLLKWVHFLEDAEGWEMELRYFRDTDKREVDFVVLKEKKPICFVECKLNEKKPGLALRYLHQKYPSVPAIQLCLKNDMDVIHKNNIRVCNAVYFLRELPQNFRK